MSWEGRDGRGSMNKDWEVGGEHADARGMCDMAARRSLQSHLW